MENRSAALAAIALHGRKARRGYWVYARRDGLLYLQRRRLYPDLLLQDTAEVSSKPQVKSLNS